MRYQATGTASSSAATPTSHHGLPRGGLRRRCGAAAAGGLLLPAPGGLEEQAHALLGERLVQEAMHRAVGDLRRQRALLGGAAGDDQHQVGELRAQARGELYRRGGEGCGIEHRDAGMVGHERGGQIDLRADRAHGVGGLGNLAQQGEELLILREHDQRR